jgi:pimeloyl-ACP methyl ester carboxylesterase
MQVRVANLPERHARYLDSGHGDTAEAGGRVVVFLHAFPLNADQWLPQLHRLPPGWRGVAPDLRGFRGDRSPQPETMDAYAADILTFMAHLEIRRAVVVGLSMGGYVALAMARQTPGRLAGLVLANTRASADSAQASSGRDRLVALAQTGGAPAVAEEMLP